MAMPALEWRNTGVQFFFLFVKIHPSTNPSISVHFSQMVRDTVFTFDKHILPIVPVLAFQFISHKRLVIQSSRLINIFFRPCASALKEFFFFLTDHDFCYCRHDNAHHGTILK